ncbi:MAG: hypothetical protein DMF40_15160 [Verrucomicrobia bacterium]|nr:MAG: hypothetical protein DME38_14595 [Verrucomicrobiota bacterium]PYL45521.1 MAG: hypothetical protein DMF40_15160 [Verrucomicrobiota bacterium]
MQLTARIYAVAGLIIGYVLVMLANPVRLALRDGFRCLARYERVWLTFALLGFAYFVFQFVTFSSLPSASEINFAEIISVSNWNWPPLSDVWRDVPLPTLEGVAGIFDNATTTYPLSALAAILFLVNWRGLHLTLWRALVKLYRWWFIPIYLVLLISTLAALLKPLVYWRLPSWNNEVSTAHLLKISASIDALSFIFEYLAGVYIQVYLITVCLSWIKGLTFRESALFAFAARRFSYVLEWAGIVVLVSMLVLRLPMLLAYFISVPDVLDYLPLQRVFMSGFILAFCSVQISLVLHNETLREAFRAHRQLIRRDFRRLAWFCLICALNFSLILVIDAIMRSAIADRTVVMMVWKSIFVFLRALVTGWLLASWVVLFRQCETGRIAQENWIRY